MNLRRFTFLLLGLMLILPVPGRAASGEDGVPETATVKVRGLGWLKGYDMRKTLRLLEPEDQRLETVNTAFIEDAVVLLQSSMESDGFLRSTGTVEVSSGGELTGTFPWEVGEVPVMPRGISADKVVFRITPGRRFWFDTITCAGLSAIPPAEVENYFIEKGFLLGGDAARMFTPGKLRNGVSNIREQLQRMGYADAEVKGEVVDEDLQSGAVDVALSVTEGELHRVGEVTVSGQFPEEAAEEIHKRAAGANGVVYSVLWRQDFVQSFRSLLYGLGYPAAEATLENVDAHDDDSGHIRGFHLVVESGPQVHVGEVRFEGDVRTKDFVMRRAAGIKSGELFLRSEVEQGRMHLGALGAFSSVRPEADPVEPDIWDLAYVVKPAKKWDVSLLAGWGSYEQLRGGIEMTHGDLNGWAHRGRLQLIQSMKSSSADYLYSMPQFLGSANDASVHAFGLRREEISFDRHEVGASFGLRRRLDFIGADAGLGYQYESVRADNFTGGSSEDVPTDSNIGTINLDLTKERLDNPISPKKGFAMSASTESAAQIFGSQVNYQRIELGLSWHMPVGPQSFVHAGLRQGIIWAFGESAAEIPLGKRFFPGGEDTLRGYGEGEASPQNADGDYIGAETVTIFNLEFEQALTEQFSGVMFVDAGTMAADVDDFPGDQQRVSVGVGLRLNSVIGPVRLEYGYNVVREPGDPKGHVHFALGFPF